MWKGCPLPPAPAGVLQSIFNAQEFALILESVKTLFEPNIPSAAFTGGDAG